MKEFGLYTVKQSYIDKVSAVDSSIAGLKGTARPFICVKDRNGRNWLIPVASLDPNAPNYSKKREKYEDFIYLDRKQAHEDGNQLLRSIHIFRDVTGLHTDNEYKNVLEYYNIIPVKHKYCKKYRDYKRNHIILDPQLQPTVKKTFRLNLAARRQGRYVGFVKYKINHGYKNFENYPKKCLEIREALYAAHNARLANIVEKRQRSRERAEQDQHKKEIRAAVRQMTSVSREQQVAALISICKQRITNEIDKDQAQEQRQAEQARQVGQAKPTGAKATGGKAKGKASHSK